MFNNPRSSTKPESAPNSLSLLIYEMKQIADQNRPCFKPNTCIKKIQIQTDKEG